MASITTWVRIEARARDADLAAGAEARLHDPLWLLARQWQLCELTGADAGSAITARTRLDVARIDAIRAVSAPWTSIDPTQAPLDVALSDAPATVEIRARDGRMLQAMLAPADAAVFLAKYPLAIDATTLAGLGLAERRFCAAMIGRVPDGDAVAEAIAPILAAGDFPSSFGIAASSIASVSARCRTWLARRDAAGRTSLGAWQSDQLAYGFEARTSTARLVAGRHVAGPVRWSDVDAAPPDAAAPGAASTPVVSTAVPSHVRYRGAPARRYWDLEDSAVVWPALSAGPGDVGRLLAIELGLTFSDDWLVVPLELPRGAVARVVSHVVTDTFGVRILVRGTTDLDAPATWHFCELARDAALAGPLVFVPPPAGPPLVGPVLDAIAFAGDDVADVLWAIDRTVLGEDGVPSSSFAPAPTAPATSARPVYTLGPKIPTTMHPYRMTTGTTGVKLVLSSIPGVTLTTRRELPPQIGVGALPSRPVQLQLTAMLQRASDGSYRRTIRHDVVDVPAPVLPPLDFDQAR